VFLQIDIEFDMTSDTVNDHISINPERMRQNPVVLLDIDINNTEVILHSDACGIREETAELANGDIVQIILPHIHHQN
jgi:hypothetical protein